MFHAGGDDEIDDDDIIEYSDEIMSMVSKPTNYVYTEDDEQALRAFFKELVEIEQSSQGSNE